MRPSLRKLWMTIFIKRKIGIFAAMVILIMALSASFMCGSPTYPWEALEEF